MSHFSHTATALASSEIVNRYGSAGAEFLKGLSGMDYQNNIRLDRSLLDIEKYKINEQFSAQNLDQQKGFSAEVAYVSKKNAQAIIDGKPVRFSRSEDIAHYGKNHQAVDIVELMDGKTVSEMQMKFVKNLDGLLNNISKGDHRYQNLKLGLPSDQVANAKQLCAEKAEKWAKQAEAMKAKGEFAKADEFHKRSETFKKLQKNIEDTGISSEEALRYRLNPRWETAKDIANVSHQAGIQGAKMGAAIGGTVSLVSNLFAYASGDKAFGEALYDSAIGTLKAAGVGYATGFAGSAIKAGMQQSANASVRSLANTALPSLVVSTCLSLGGIIQRYAKGEISESELLFETGKTTASTLSASFVAGQLAIPVPVLGGLIGGMLGYTLCNSFFNSLSNVRQETKASAERYQLIAIRCEASKAMAKQYQADLNNLFETKLNRLDISAQQLFSLMDNPNTTADDFAREINHFAELLGKKLPIQNRKEMDSFMASDEVLVL